MSLISVKKLSKVYDNDGAETTALDHVDLEVNKGDFLAIMGASGSGKSTLLHILGFLDRPTHGSYTFNGKSINGYGDDELAKIRNKEMGFVFQAFNLLPRSTVYENVKMPLIYSDTPETKWDEITRKAIKEVDLDHRIDHEVTKLSGGEKQRVAIARALVLEPQVIFADEPTGNLDSKSGQAIMEIIQRLNEEEGHTIILVTHETYTAEHAERIITMKDGKIEQDRKVVDRHRARDHFIK